MRFLPEKSSIFPQVSGISFKVNTGIKSSVEVDELEMFVRVAGERRVSDVYVGEEKLDLKKIIHYHLINILAMEVMDFLCLLNMKKYLLLPKSIMKHLRYILKMS